MTGRIDRRTLLTGTAAATVGLVDAANGKAAVPTRNVATDALSICADLSMGAWKQVDLGSEDDTKAFALMIKYSGYGRFNRKRLRNWARKRRHEGFTAEVYAFFIGDVADHGFTVAHGLNKTIMYFGPTGAQKCLGWRKETRVKALVDSFQVGFELVQGRQTKRNWWVDAAPHGSRLTTMPIYSYIRKEKDPHFRLGNGLPPGGATNRVFLEVTTT